MEVNTLSLKPGQGLSVEILKGGADRYCLVHLNLCQFVAQAQAVGEPPRLHRMGRHVRLEGFDVFFPEDSVEPPMKIGVTFFYLKFVHPPLRPLGFARLTASLDSTLFPEME